MEERNEIRKVAVFDQSPFLCNSVNCVGGLVRTGGKYLHGTT